MRPLDPNESVVGLAGDWHGNRAKARDAVKTLAALGVRSLFHLGDLGISPEGPDASTYPRFKVLSGEPG